ncbi:hypothetical protein J4217_02370 [Candidatus Pacearchaeota archaeon]|nr:hypothetical protein [Candidatus Pacearchaeota archaeon]
MAIRYKENVIGAWAFFIGLVLAILVGLVARNNINPWIQGVLAVLGLVVGYFVAEKDVQTFLLASLSLVLVSFAGIQGMVLNAAVAGTGLTRAISYILGALLNLFVPATIVVALKTVFSISKS